MSVPPGGTPTDSRPTSVHIVAVVADNAGSSVAAVTKAGQVLSAFTPATSVLSVRQIAARTGIPRSTAHVLCTTLVSSGLLRAGRRGYELGPLVLELGAQVIERTGLVRAAEGILDSTAHATEQELHLGQLTEGWVVYLLRKSGVRRQDMQNRVGQRAPAHLTGCGKAALSRLDEAEVAEHVRRWAAATDRPVPDLRALTTELATARSQGFVLSRTFQRHRVSVAAPVFDASGRPVGGVSIAGPDAVFTRAVLLRSRSDVTDLAQRVTDRLAIVAATPRARH